MDANRRRTLALVLIGMAAMLIALLVVELVRQRRCAAAGGSWEAAARACTDASGAPLAVGGGAAYVLALPIAGLVALLLWRVFSAASRFRR
jgi:hypothetical protein